MKDKERLGEEYKKQKKVVQDKIRQEILSHEEKITREIKEGKDHGQKLCNNIKKLRPKN